MMDQDAINEIKARLERQFAGLFGLNIDEVAAFFGTSAPTVRRLISSGALESYKDGRHRKVPVAAVIDRAETLLQKAERPRPLPWQRKMKKRP